MKDDLRQILDQDPERKFRSRRLLESITEPTDSLDDLIWDSRMESAARLDPSLASSSLWLVRLSGEAVRDGWISAEMQNEIVGPLTREVELATPPSARAESRLGLVGVSAGSVVLHFRPASAKRLPRADQLGYDLSPIDEAVLKVLDLHNLFERRAPATEIARRYGTEQGLLRQAKQLVHALESYKVELSTRWWSAESHRRSSRLSQVGQEYAQELFSTSLQFDADRLQGMITALDISGIVTITPASGRPKYKVIVEAEDLRSPRFGLGERVDIMVRRESAMDRVGSGPVRSTYRFVRHADAEDPPLFDLA
ncbi:hypothetical protein [Leifsonia sp. NPDC080035]|uniref:Uncharacterized protein n=1 Tax=Leifsonia sp. NPDC080035 TaxID=3143936 RepID=A0AAU7GD64_9MICO